MAALYTLHIYGGQRSAAMDEGAVREEWARLRGPLSWFRWLRWVQRCAAF